MPYEADYLYKARTGAFPTSGQSLRSALAAGAAGIFAGDAAKASHLITGFNTFTGDPPDIASGIKASGYQWVFGWSISRGARAANIQRTGAGIVGVRRTDPAYDQHAGQELNILASNIAGATGSMTLETKGAYKLGTPYGDAWYVGYVEPSQPTDQDVKEISFWADLGFAGGLSTHDMYFELYYDPDGGPFNPQITYPLDARITERYETLDNIEVEWHTNSSYTSFYTDSHNFGIFSWPQETHTYWLRWRRVGSGSWTNYGAVIFYDNR